jgi:hypothetical protein
VSKLASGLGPLVSRSHAPMGESRAGRYAAAADMGHGRMSRRRRFRWGCTCHIEWLWSRFQG